MPKKVRRTASKKAKRATAERGMILLNPTYEETMSPKAYVTYVPREAHNIASVRIIPPVLGEKGFGKVIVRRNSPLYGYIGSGFGWLQ